MAKDKITEYDATAANNTVVGDVNLAENSALPSDMNNAVRELMSHQKEAFGSGTPLYVDQTNNRVGIGEIAPVTPLTIATTNKLGSTFTGTTNGEGLTVTQTDYTSGNYISLVEAAYDDSGDGSPNVRIGAMFDGGGSNLAFGTSNSYGSGITNTAMFIESSGFVGIGTDSPDAVADIAGSGVPLEIDSTNSNTYKVQFKNNGTVTSYLGTTSNAFYFGNSSAAQLARLDSDGLKLGTDSAAANALSKIEEGTFIATLNGGSTTPTPRVTTTGYYTKVNDQVFISINFENISTTGYSGSISVFGLPFACGNGAARQVFTIAFYELASFSGTGGAFGHLSATGTEIFLLNNRSTNSWENLTHAAGSANRYLVITGTYSAA